MCPRARPPRMRRSFRIGGGDRSKRSAARSQRVFVCRASRSSRAQDALRAGRVNSPAREWRRAGPRGRISRMPTPAQATPPARTPILIVDDDADIRVALEMLLQYDGFEVWTAKDGAEALARIEQEQT